MFRCVRPLLSLFVFSTLGVSATPLTVAITPVSAAEYGLEVKHAQVSEVTLGKGVFGLRVHLTLTNSGSHSLYDLRLAPLRVGPTLVQTDKNTARLRRLPVGAQETLTYTFPLATQAHVAQLVPSMLFRIEAVDESSQQQVTFNQVSREVR